MRMDKRSKKEAALFPASLESFTPPRSADVQYNLERSPSERVSAKTNSTFTLTTTSNYLSNIPSSESITRRKFLRVFLWILVLQFTERIAFFLAVGTMFPFLFVSRKTDVETASAFQTLFVVLSCCLSFLGGHLGDTLLGRYRAIQFSSSIVLVGLLLMIVATISSLHSAVLFLIAALLFLSTGAAGMSSNIGVFGADQYDFTDPAQAKAQQMFFSYLLFAISGANAVSSGYLTDLAVYGNPPEIPTESGYFVAFFLCTSSMAVGVMLFLFARRQYFSTEGEGRFLPALLEYIVHSARCTLQGKLMLSVALLHLIFVGLVISQAFHASSALSLSCFLAGFSAFILSVTALRNSDFCRPISDRPGLKQQDAKDTLRLIPILLSVGVAVGVQKKAFSFTIRQTCQSNIFFSEKSPSPYVLSIGDSLGVLLFVPLLEHCIFPLCERAQKRAVSRTQKIVAGFVIAVLACEVAAILEMRRRASPVLGPSLTNQHCAAGVGVNDFSGFIMYLPMMLLGLSQSLMIPPVLFFAYDQCPKTARGFTQAVVLYSLVLSMAFWNGLDLLAEGFVPRGDLNKGNLEFVYQFVVLILGICSLLFLRNSLEFQKKNFVVARFSVDSPERESTASAPGEVEVSIVSGAAFSESRGSVLYKL